MHVRRKLDNLLTSEWTASMVEALVLWNEPNNLSHWNFKLDPDWIRFADMVREASAVVRGVNPALPIVFGGVSRMRLRFPSADGSPWSDGARRHRWRSWISTRLEPLANHEWPAKVDEAAEVSGKPVWVLEVGASSFGAEEVAEFGLTRTLELLRGKVNRIHWYSLLDLPAAGPQRRVTRKQKARHITAITISG